MGILPFTFWVKLFWTFSWIALPLKNTLKFRTEVIFCKHFSNCFFCSILKVLAMVRSAEMTGLDLNPLAFHSNGPEKGNMHSKWKTIVWKLGTNGYFGFQGICLPVKRLLKKSPAERHAPQELLQNRSRGVPSQWLERNGHSLCMVSSSFS